MRGPNKEPIGGPPPIRHPSVGLMIVCIYIMFSIFTFILVIFVCHHSFGHWLSRPTLLVAVRDGLSESIALLRSLQAHALKRA